MASGGAWAAKVVVEVQPGLFGVEVADTRGPLGELFVAVATVITGCGAVEAHVEDGPDEL